MRPKTKAKAVSARNILWGVPSVLGLALGLILQAAPNAPAVADAAKADDLTAVRKLIKEHADVNTPANDGSTALLWAAYHSNVDLTKALVAAGASVDAANHYGVTP